MVPEVVLASSSPRRTELLRMLGIAHRVVSVPVDETMIFGDSVPSNVSRLAREKAFAVASRVTQGLVIGADTVVVFDNQIFGKPTDANDAVDMLRKLQGHVHEVFSGVAVIDAKTLMARVDYRRVEVKMRKLSDAEIVSYVNTREPLDKAGAYAIQGVGARFIEWICGDYYAVVGLPLELTAHLLIESGYSF